MNEKGKRRKERGLPRSKSFFHHSFIPSFTPSFLALFALAFFSLIWLLRIPTDIQDHHYDLQMMLQGRHFVATFGYFLAVLVASLGIPHPYALVAGSVLVLAGAVVARYELVRRFLLRHASAEPRQAWLIGLALSMVFVINLPGPKNWLIGQFPPNVWHNSTSIFLMPFALALFGQGLRFFEKPGSKGSLWLLLWVALNVVIKPSFFFVFAPVFGLWMLGKWGLRREFWWAAWPLLVGTVLILLEYYAIFQWNSFRATPPPETGLSLAPFHVWRFHSSNLLLSLLGSLAFPLSYLLLFPKSLHHFRPLQWAGSMFLLGLLIFILVAETGIREYDANFIWQCYIANFMLFMSCLADQGRRTEGWRRLSRKDYLALAVLGLHLLSGLLYLGKILILKNYY
jgi:hypothetical protein